jgi:ubiquinone/menaquinone biosynthesis C-methylase UbiE
MSNNVIVKEHYRDNDVADSYIVSRFSTPLAQVQHEKQVSLINEAIKKYALSNALELAPGPLRVTAGIVGLKRGFALDYSESMLYNAVRRIKHNETKSPWFLQRGDAFSLPFKADAFDLIFSFRFIRHFQAEERTRIFSEIYRTLKPEGFLIFEAPNYFTETKIRTRMRSPQLAVYDKLWKREEIMAEMEENKFKVLKLDNNISYFDIQVNISRFHRLKLGALAKKLICGLDRYPSAQPYEWIVLCQKK